MNRYRILLALCACLALPATAQDRPDPRSTVLFEVDGSGCWEDVQVQLGIVNETAESGVEWVPWLHYGGPACVRQPVLEVLAPAMRSCCVVGGEVQTDADGKPMCSAVGLIAPPQGFQCAVTQPPTISPAQPASAVADRPTTYANDFDDSTHALAGWNGLQPGNSLQHDPNLLALADRGTGAALRIVSRETNQHGVYMAGLGWGPNQDVAVEGLIDHPDKGWGWTVLSGLPHADSYVRVRRGAFDRELHFSPHGGECEAGTNLRLGYFPEPGVPFRVALESRSLGDGRVRVRAKAYTGEPPASWQAECIVSHRSAGGSTGPWTMGPGTALFDDLTVELHPDS